jgi:hypothetical protein
MYLKRNCYTLSSQLLLQQNKESFLQNNLYKMHLVPNFVRKLISVVKLDEDFVPTFIAFSDNGADLVILGNANSPGPFFYQLK